MRRKKEGGHEKSEIKRNSKYSKTKRQNQKTAIKMTMNKIKSQSRIQMTKARGIMEKI